MKRWYITICRPGRTRGRCIRMRFWKWMWLDLLSVRWWLECREDGWSGLPSGLETEKVYLWSRLFWCVCVINDSRYAKEDEECNQYEKSLLASPRLTIVEFQQKETHTVNHLVDSSRVGLVVTRKTGISKVLCTNYRKTELASSVQLEYISKNSLFYRKYLERSKICFVRKHWVLWVVFFVTQTKENKTGKRPWKITFHDFKYLWFDKTEIEEHEYVLILSKRINILQGGFLGILYGFLTYP